MGGKVQQRVAGNVKPASSGRIRELLADNPAVGKIITFSTLSTTSQQKQQPQQPPKKQVEVKEETITSTQPTPSSPSTDKVALVVKKIGNRDCFTRVRVPVEPQAVVEASDKIPSEDNSDSRNVQFNPREDKIEQSSHESEQETTLEEVKEPEVDFDTLIQQLDQMLTIESANSDDGRTNMINRECEIIKLLRLLIGQHFEELSIQELDLITTSIHRWISMILDAKDNMSKPDMAHLCVNIFEFIHYLIELPTKLSGDQDSEDKYPMLGVLRDEMDNFHTSKVYENIVKLFFSLSKVEKLTQEESSILEALGRIVVDVKPETIILDSRLTNDLDSTIEFDHNFKVPENCQYCPLDEVKFKSFIAISRLLTSNNRVVSISAHAMLAKNIQMICESIQSELESICQDNDVSDILLLPPTCLTSVLTSRDTLLSVLLGDYRVGDISVTIEPNSDSYTCVLTYLFVWDLVIQYIVGVDKEIGHKIIHSLKKLSLIQNLLDNIFMLLPPLSDKDYKHLMLVDGLTKTGNSKNQWSLSEFLKRPLKTEITRPINEIELIALHIYFSMASHMPMSVRKWFNNNSNKKLCNLVNEYTVKHISQIVCSLEMESVQEKCQERADKDKLDNLVIRARPTAKEVYAIYTRDEFRMELTIKLPNNYPLAPVQIDGGKRVGVTDLKWRSWLLQLMTFLSHQNGPILDGIDLWRKNIDKKFEGKEKCMICFSILHSNYQLPKKRCATCSKMYHNLCLYKWFQSSGNSTCPLCRSIW